MNRYQTQSVGALKRTAIRSVYQYALKPIFFLQDPEDVHDRMISLGKRLGSSPAMRLLARAAFDYEHPILVQTIAGIQFQNPIGLAAGFDKNAQLVDILPDVGFGFAEVGSITGEPCSGNPRPRLWRLKKSKSLLVYYGLKNDGCEVVASRLKKKIFRIPIGISVAKTNCPATADPAVGIADYKKAFDTFRGVGHYYTINISCPNAFGGEPFTDPTLLEALLTALDLNSADKPVFLKISPDLSESQLDAIIDVVFCHRIAGFICSNLTKRRDNDHLKDGSIPATGGMSGKVSQGLSDAHIRYLYKKTKNTYCIIGCGGVFTAEDAYMKIRAGASLIQMITGMIYEGPQTIGAINDGLVRLLKRDGFENITQAIGVDSCIKGT